LGLAVQADRVAIHLGDKSQTASLGWARNVSIAVGQRVSHHDLIVIPDGMDLILGMPWVQRQFPEWKKGIDALKRYESGVTADAAVLGEGNQEWMMSHLQLKRCLRKGQEELGLCLLKSLDDDREEAGAEMKTRVEGVDEALAKELAGIQKEFPEVFPDKLPGLPPRRGVEHRIETEDNEPIYRAQYRLSPKERETLKEQMKELVDLGLVRPSRSGYSAPVLFVKKSDGSLRMVVDYRALNKKTVRDRFPLPRISDLLDRLQRAKYYTKMDLQQGFYQIRMAESDIHKTAFHGGDGLYEMVVMPMGLCNAPSTFQRMMRTVVTSEMDGFALVYLDDILIFSETAEEHSQHVQRVLERLRQHGLCVKRSKCEFGRTRIKFVGQVIEGGRRRIDPERICEIQELPPPSSVHEVRSFAGIINFVRDHAPHASEIMAPVTDLLKKNAKFEWGPRHQEAWERVKALVASNKELYLPDPELPWVLETDASLIGLGAALYQLRPDGTKVPVCFASKRLTATEMNYPTHERELYGILYGCSTFRHYLEGVRFEVRTDHHALRYIETQPNLSRRVVRWVDYLQRFDQAITYIKGSENNVADFLSRLPGIRQADVFVQPLEAGGVADGPPEAGGDAVRLQEAGGDQEQAWGVPRPVQPELEMDGPDWPLLLLSDELPPGMSAEFREFLEAQRPHFQFENGVLYRQAQPNGRRLKFVPFPQRLRLVSGTHSFAHLHWQEVHRRLAERAWWPRMRQDIESWVRRCPRCQIHGRNNHQPQAPAVMTGIPDRFQRWGIDAVGPLPATDRGNRYILHAKEYATKWDVAVAVTNIDSITVANFIYEHIFLPFGPPAEIISDRGSQFCAQVLETYLRRQGTAHWKTSAYHPRSNGVVENGHWIITKTLAKACMGAVHRWDDFLPEALFHLRRRRNAVTGFTPYYLVYGREPVLPGDLLEPPMCFDHTDPRDRAEMIARLQEEINRTDRGTAEFRRRQQALDVRDRFNLRVVEDPLSVGNWVLLKRGEVMNNHRIPKFDPKWVGPYQVTEVCDNHTYKLRRADGQEQPGRVHRDRLKRCFVDPNRPPTQPWTPDVLEDFETPEDFEFPFPEAVVAARLVLGASDNVPHYVPGEHSSISLPRVKAGNRKENLFPNDTCNK
jgi:hypothetical protein